MSSELSRPRAIRWYFWLSAFVIAVDVYFAGWPVFEGRVLHRFEYDPSAAPTWIDYIGAVFVYLLLPAIFGLGAVFVRKAHSARTYFATATLIGALTVWCNYELSLFGHVDCGNDCVAAVPSYASLRWVAWVTAIPAILVPAVLTVVSSLSARRVRGTR